ncbi:MAG: hypothetical protein ACE5H1_00800 [Thermodesulfobacteriota bacterium]
MNKWLESKKGADMNKEFIVWLSKDKLKDNEVEIKRLRKAIKDAEKYLRYEGTKQNVARQILSNALNYRN